MQNTKSNISTTKKTSVESTENGLYLKKFALRSSARAIRESKALDLNITYIDKGNLVQESAEGKIKIIKKVPSKQGSFKGKVFYAKKTKN